MFFRTSLKFVSMEQIWIAKVISDNQDTKIDINDKEFVTGLLSEHMDKIQQVVKFYESMSKELQEINCYPEEYYYLINKIKFSFSEQVQLKKVVTKLLNSGVKIDMGAMERLGSGKEVLVCLDLLKEFANS